MGEAPTTGRAVDAHAKVNLHLEVLGRRADGYHEVVTVLHELELCDTLVGARTGGGIELTVASEVGTGLPVAAGADNLVHRAAEAYFAARGVGGGARLHLHKRIPAGGGLGGGSSDAAATLRLLDELCAHPMPEAELHDLACGLGADVPFFLAGGTQVGTGIGADLAPLAGPPELWFVLILPPVGTSTPAVYKNLRAHLTTGTAEASIPSVKAPDGKQLAMASGFRNDLEAAALELHPELADLRRSIREAGYPTVCMSGSGSTFFLACRDEGACDGAMERLAPLERAGVGLVRTRSASSRQRDSRPAPFPGAAGN